MSAVAGVRRLEHSVLAYRHAWRGSLFETIVAPILYLSALGVFLGGFIGSADALDGVTYLVFLGPGLLAAQAMQTGALESAWPLYATFKWTRTFEAVLGTPQAVRDIVLGHLYWLVVRIAFGAAIFLGGMILFSSISASGAVAAFPAAVLTGVAFGMPLAAWTAAQTTEMSLSVIFRAGITPLFIFSGTLFPVEQLPDPLPAMAWFTPLFHGVELTRALALGQPTPTADLAVHTAVLLAMAIGGTLVAFRTFRRRLVV